jgi:dTMP kinase
MKLKQGYLFSIEGTDGCGKTTLIKNLLQALSDYKVKAIATKEPGATHLGKNIRTMLMNRSVETCALAEFLLFAADRAQHFTEFIMPHINENFIVISDRMADSSLVYQGFIKGLDQSMIKTVNQWAMQNRQPDLVFYMKIDAIGALERMHTRNEGFLPFEEEILQKKYQLVDGYDLIFSQRPDVVILDAHKSVEEITNQVIKTIVRYIKNKT